MVSSLAIGDFSRATHLTVKTSRHYHDTGLLEPAQVDPQTGYRRYTMEQIAVAQIIRRFRDLDMPLNEIRAVLSAPDVQVRNELISAHLQRLEDDLSRTQTAVASLRGLLECPTPATEIVHRTVAGTTVAAIFEVVTLESIGTWFAEAIAEIYTVLKRQRLVASGPSGGMYSNALFSEAHGEATVFVPCGVQVKPDGRVAPRLLPNVELATLVHRGSHVNVDIAYGTLASYVTRHTLAVEGPLRESYLVGARDTSEVGAWRTELG